MLELRTLRTLCKGLYKSELPLFSKLPHDCLPLSTMRVSEQKFEGLHWIQGGPFYPLWFHAESERNIFLWKQGLSLLEAEEFDFWIFPKKLIEKRKTQLLNASAEDPFSNPLWSTESSGAFNAQDEIKYLEDLTEAFNKTLPHLNALARAVYEFEREEKGEQKPLILLPGNKMRG